MTAVELLRAVRAGDDWGAGYVEVHDDGVRVDGFARLTAEQVSELRAGLQDNTALTPQEGTT